jgi:ubiquinone/menaquinone biosynthesis C-methylase UbiE
VRNTAPSGGFGGQAHQYDAGRKGLPEFVLDYIWSRFEIQTPSLLDVGCGTGITTRQLASRCAHVTAVDVSEPMLATARRVYDPRITYRLAAANALPFSRGSFDIVAAFSAFHWFPQPSSIHEMQRVLRPGGMILVVNRSSVGSFDSAAKDIMRSFAGIEIPRRKAGYDPSATMEAAGLLDVQVRHFTISEFYTERQAADYFQSLSAWNFVPARARHEAMESIRRYVDELLLRGIVERRVDIAVYLARA